MRDLSLAGAPAPPARTHSDARQGLFRSNKFAQLANSAWFAVLISIVTGILYACAVIGPSHINPRNTGWLEGDPAQQYIAWQLYRQDPHWHWPLTYTKNIGYRAGDSVALMDVNPVFAIPLKVISPLLPDHFQYFGIETIAASVLQFLFGFLLFRLVLGPNLTGILLCSTFFLLSPVMTQRMGGHYTLTNHWLLVAGLALFVAVNRAERTSAWTFGILGALLATLSIAMHPYLAFQVFVIVLASLLSLVWRSRLTLAKSTVILAAIVLSCGLVAYCFGFVMPGGKGYGAPGYRIYSMNLLAPFDPFGNTSAFLKALPQATTGQREGYAYFGAGVLALGLIVLLLGLLLRKKLPRPSLKTVGVLVGCCVLLTLLALSTRATIGSWTLYDLDPRERFSAYFAPLRASGRLFWLPYYAVLMTIVALPYWLLPRHWASALLCCALALQVADTRPLRTAIRLHLSRVSPPTLKSPVWNQLAARYQNLIVLPAWECGGGASPGGPSGYMLFGFLAVEHHMRTNSYYPGRIGETLREAHCVNAVSDVLTNPLSPDSLYVVTLPIAAEISLGKHGGECRTLDGFILCTSSPDPTLASGNVVEAIKVNDAFVNPGFEAPQIAPWVPFQSVEASPDRSHFHNGIQSLGESVAEGSVYQDISGLVPGKTYAISAWVSGAEGATSTAQLAVFDPHANVATFSAEVPVLPHWQLVSMLARVSKGGGVFRIHLFRNKGSGTIYWDDVKIAEVSP